MLLRGPPTDKKNVLRRMGEMDVDPPVQKWLPTQHVYPARGTISQSGPRPVESDGEVHQTCQKIAEGVTKKEPREAAAQAMPEEKGFCQG